MPTVLALFVLSSLIVCAFSSSPPLFCKCTCFTNSTIIQLPQHGGSGSSCNQCSRAFCTGQNLPMCKLAKDTDIITTCFQRDSRKDQIIVLLFIASTVGLLVWVAIQQCLQIKSNRPRVQEGDYTPLGSGQS